MTDMLMQYGLFFAKALTVVVAFAAIAVIVVSVSRRERAGDRLEVKDLGRRYEAMAHAIEKEVLSKKVFKLRRKADKASRKQRKKADREAGGDAETARARLFVMEFRGDIKATAVASLREEVTSVLRVAGEGDEVLLRLDNAGGIVHEHGLAASQLMRLKDAGVPLTVAVDKVAASGGYMMACVADRILAAPFAVLGSVGVLAQVPNFRRLLDRKGIEFEQIKAGEFKRTVTMFGRNTDADREKLQADVNDVHAMFKEFVSERRPGLDIDRVSTGEHWYGRRALDLGLVDELRTSDDYLAQASRTREVYQVRYVARRRFGESLATLVETAVERALLALARPAPRQAGG